MKNSDHKDDHLSGTVARPAAELPTFSCSGRRRAELSGSEHLGGIFSSPRAVLEISDTILHTAYKGGRL